MRIVRLFGYYEARFQLIFTCKSSSFMHEACVEYDVYIEGNDKSERAIAEHAQVIFIELKVCV